MRRPWIAGVSCLLLLAGSSAFAGVETVKIAKVQHIRNVNGIVRDPSGTPIPGVQIEIQLRGKDVMGWTMSHLDGHFVIRHLAPGDYDMKIHAAGFNPMLYHLRIDEKGTKGLLIVQMQVAT